MTKKLKIAFWLYIAFDVLIGGFCGGLLPLTPLCGAQTILTTTTLSAAVPGPQGVSSAIVSGGSGFVQVASATNINAPQPVTGITATLATSTYLFVDRELMDVRAVSGTTVTVVRGAGGTGATSHVSGALVFVIPGQAIWDATTGQIQAIPSGSCTRGNEQFLPRIDFKTGTISDCLGGQWVNGDAMQTTRVGVTGSASGTSGFRYPEPGSTVYTSIQTAGTAPAANTQIECTEIDLPFSMLLTGLAPLNGSTVGTDKHWVLLYDSAGAVLATSAAAGATTSGASTYQKYSFTAPFYAVGPARYFACYGTNGTTDTIRHTLTQVNDNVLAGAVTGQVFGTAAAITPPSTFTTAKGPYWLLF